MAEGGEPASGAGADRKRGGRQAGPAASRVRRFRRHLLLAAVAAGLALAVFLLVDRDRLQTRVSMATAYAALAFLAASLALGPLRVLRGRHAPANVHLRRDVGIWAGVLGLVHVIAGLTVHLPGRTWLYFLEEVPTASAPLPVRLDLFGAANHTGLAAALLLLLLLALSNDRSLRALGTGRWKRLQRWNYGAFGLTAIHGVLYQVIESRALVFVAVFAAALAGVVVLQAAGFRARRRRRGG